MQNPKQMRRRRYSNLPSFLQPLEPRILLSTGAQPTWNVSFNDPGGTWSAFYADITRVAQAAGQEWGTLFDSNAGIEVSVEFDPTLSTAAGRSATTVFNHTTPEGINVFDQGVASELNTAVDPNDAEPDIQMSVGVMPGANYLTDFLWFDSDPLSRTAPIPANRVDAFSVFLHEIGHAIAYNGWRDGTTGQIPADYESPFDQFVYQSNGYLYFNGPQAHAAYGADPAMTLGDIYHWGNADPGPDPDLIPQLMNGVEFDYQTRYDISPIDVGVMRDVGMKLDPNPPQVTSSRFLYETSQSLVFTFDESVAASLNLSALSLVRVGPGNATPIPNSDLNLTYDRPTNTASITFNDPNHILPDGDYRLTLSAAAVTDLAGNPMLADSSLDFFTLGGDANHDHHIDADDYFLIDRGFVQKLTGYGNGDFDDNVTVDADDYFIIDSNYIRQRNSPAQPQNVNPARLSRTGSSRHHHHRHRPPGTSLAIHGISGRPRCRFVEIRLNCSSNSQLDRV